MTEETPGIGHFQADLREDDLADLAIALDAVQRIRQRHRDPVQTEGRVGWLRRRQIARHMIAATEALELGLVLLSADGAAR